MEEAKLIDYLKGNLPEKEQIAIQGWIKEDVQNERMFLQLAKLYYTHDTHQRIMSRDILDAYNRVSRCIQKRDKRIVLRHILYAAACIVIIALVSIGFLKRPHPEKMTTSQTITMTTNSGMRAVFDLPDGSIVHLNSGSSISYPLLFDKKERRVSVQGECYFDIAHNEKQPFIVDIAKGKLQIEVLGTKFNVQAYKDEDYIKTTLVEGKVKLKMSDATGGQSVHELKPSEKASYNKKSDNVQICSVNTLFDTAWLDGSVVFKDTPMSEVLNRLSHFYDVSFEIKDAVINTYTFTGTFKNRQLFQILDYLKISSNIDYKMINPEEDDGKNMNRPKIILTDKKR